MRDKLSIVMSWALVVMTMLIIYNFSAQPAAESTVVSEGVVVEILDVVMDKEEITPPVIQKFQFPIRKGAHITIFMLLGFCMLSAITKSFRLKLWVCAIISEIACILYAILDEIRQSFSEGRSANAFDVMIDSTGATLGILIFVLFLILYHKFILKSRIC